MMDDTVLKRLQELSDLEIPCPETGNVIGGKAWGDQEMCDCQECKLYAKGKVDGMTAILEREDS